MEMVKEQENGVVTENKTTLVNQNLMELNICFHQILETCTNMNGSFIYAMHKNINTLTPYLKSINDARSVIIKQYAKLDKDGNPTGQLVSRFTYDDQRNYPNEGVTENGQHYIDFDNNEMYKLLQDDKNPYEFIFAKGDLGETFTPYMDRAKGTFTLDPQTGKKSKGNMWYATAGKLDTKDPYVQVKKLVPGDPGYDPAAPYQKITTYIIQRELRI